MFKIVPIPAFKDNYIWCIIKAKNAILVDPGDATPAIAYLNEHQLSLQAILVTHHHYDHMNGVEELTKQYHPLVFAPKNENNIDGAYSVSGSDKVDIIAMEMTFEVIDIPGHTLGHVAYYHKGMLFCGDTLFSAGCGRLFEGTAKDMLTSLNKLQALPDDTAIYCGHEYTLANLQFAHCVEPDNKHIEAAIKRTKALRDKNLPSLPGILAEEKTFNPFLRIKESTVHQAAEEYSQQTLQDPVDVFKIIREWKNAF